MGDFNRNHRQIITKIFEKYSDDVLRYFLKYTGSQGMADHVAFAEDMRQDLFVKLMDYEAMIVDETAKSFVFTIAHRMIIDHARHMQFVRRASKAWVIDNENDHFWQDNDTLECKQIREMEIRKMRSLPRRMAQVYEMTRFEELSSQEIAERMQISKRTVEYHLLMSRKEIRSSLRKAINS